MSRLLAIGFRTLATVLLIGGLISLWKSNTPILSFMEGKTNVLRRYSGQTSAEELLQFWKKRSQSIVGQLEPMTNINTENTPFIFFHLRKCGGKTIRKDIHTSLNEIEKREERNISRWIPCFQPKSCIPYSLPPNTQQVAVYASHVSYATMLTTVRERTTIEKKTGTLLNGTNITFHSLQDEEEGRNFGGCLTNLRSTVNRVVSCWNYRMVGLGLPPANELTAQDWDTLLPAAYDRFNNGCNNEIFRAFGSSSADETFVNTITQGHPSFAYEFNRSAHHLSSCVIVMVNRCNESNAVISHYMPWLNKVNLCQDHINESHLSSKTKTLQESASKIILQHNQMDDLLFQFGEKLFEEQVKVATQRM